MCQSIASHTDYLLDDDKKEDSNSALSDESKLHKLSSNVVVVEYCCWLEDCMFNHCDIKLTYY